ncbi:MAG: dihydroxy-acid dehydratase, partial [Acidobacteria bacterium]|nr:dihydroxy-acid dehydratase [Acidobacteriota bacterium]
KVINNQSITLEDLRRVAAHNAPDFIPAAAMSRETLFEKLLAEKIIKFGIVISGQGPEAYGMPEMFTPMQYINANRTLKRLTVLITDGRYSGVSYGAAIGHLTPEAKRGGGILYLQTGDLLQLNMRLRDITLIDRAALQKDGTIQESKENLVVTRKAIGKKRLQTINKRLLEVVPTNRMRDVTDAARGVIPNALAEAVGESYQPTVKNALAQAGD